MLRSYEAIYSHGQLQWLDQAPPEEAEDQRVLVIVDLNDHVAKQVKKNEIRELLQRTREALATNKTPEEIDSELKDMREEWKQKWEQ